MSTENPYVSVLRRHVLQPWFPRSIDREHGGFLCDFDGDWRSCGPHDKLLEFQARQTLSAAELLLAFPDESVLREAVSVGFECLRHQMWDHEYGGWHALADRAGVPLRPERKHSHGIAYAIQACLAVHLATGEPAALALAREALDWVDRDAHDREHGGYFGPLARDGSRLVADPDGRRTDMIGTPFGLKDMNVNSDFYELLVYARAAGCDTPLVSARLAELRSLMLDLYAAPGQPAWHYHRPDWSPAAAECRPATAAQTACRLLEDASAPDRNALHRAARRLVVWAFDKGWNPKRRGMHFKYDFGSTYRDPATLEWWAQFELLKASAYLSRFDPDDGEIGRIRACGEEAVFDGLLGEASPGSRCVIGSAFGWHDRLPPFRRRRRAAARKAQRWKDASHDARTFLRLMWLEGTGTPVGVPGLIALGQAAA